MGNSKPSSHLMGFYVACTTPEEHKTVLGGLIMGSLHNVHRQTNAPKVIELNHLNITAVNPITQ